MKKSVSSRILYILTVCILCVFLYLTYQYYQTNNFNKFVKSEANLYTSDFKKDYNVKYDNKATYKISSSTYNDAMFYEKVKVEKDQPYKVTCMVKTENVTPKENNSAIGAQISIEGSTERSVAIQGTSDWQKIELIFNSKDRTTVNIGFRLGGNAGQASGTAWFSGFSLEEGIAENNNNWNFACFILENTNVNVDGKNISLHASNSDISDIKSTIKRFSNSCEKLSNGKMTANCDVYEIQEPLTELSYDKDYGYYASPENVESQIKNVISNNQYDHIFVIVRLRR